MIAAPPSASVVLCCYNGERYLPEQLTSLRAQTQPPAELVVQDDGSTDATPELLERFAREAPFPVKLFRNERRLGFAQNFATALPKASGELLFLCDHDDVWDPRKLERLGARFRDPAVGLAFSDTSLITADGQPLPGTGFGRNGLGEEKVRRWEQGAAFADLLRSNPVPGMSMAFRAHLRERFLPIPPGWEHDYWILLVAAGSGVGFAVEPTPLVAYRQHAAQAIGGTHGWRGRLARARGQTLAQRGEEAVRLDALLLRLQSGGQRSILDAIRGKRAHLLRRGGFAANPALRLWQISGELCGGSYHRFDNGVSSALRDLLAPKA